MEELKNNQNAADIISKGLEDDDITPEQLQQLSDKIEENNGHTGHEGEKELGRLSLEELADKLAEIIQLPINEIRQKVELIRNLYYKKRNEILEDLRQKFIEEGGNTEDFKTPMDILEVDRKFKDAFDAYKEKRDEYEEQQRKEHEKNLVSKQEIIEKIKQLIKSTDNFDKVYRDFKNLEKQWRQIGSVPKEAYKELMNDWNHIRKQFYDLVRINKELKEFDLQRNLEQKLALIERAEALIYYDDPVKAYKELQELHSEWKEIGPVPQEKRDEIWEQFRQISSQINKRHQEYFKKIKEIQKKNLEAKTRLCEAAEKISTLEITTPKEWQEKTKIILELQQLWRKVGRVPKKYNQSIYERFRSACDKFFENKREFFRHHQELLEENYKKKEKLAQRAEQLKDSTEWSKTAREFEKLFSEWKKIGPVAKEKSEEIWQRFRTARLEFFRRKRQFMKELRKKERENMHKKLELIEKIKNLELSENQEENIKLLDEIEKEWSAIGFVPYKEKDKINKEYHQALDAKFSQVNLDSENRRQMQFKNRLENLLKSPKAKHLILREIDKQKTFLQKLKTEQLKLENNLEMFKDSPEEFLKEFRARLDTLKQKIKKIEDNINLLIQEYKKL